ncbi:hypothetical protein I4U23_027202 [Adineta vaga]|nr:hypothetical protein I4U23_027202 [Adineta vaga]
MLKHSVLFIVLLCHSFIVSIDSCSCVAEVPLEKQFFEATHVFIGKVLHIEFDKKQFEHQVTFKVEKIFKGLIPSDHRLIARTALNSAACGVSFRTDEQWQVWTYGIHDNPRVSLCSPSTKHVNENIGFLNRYASSASNCRQTLTILIISILVLFNYHFFFVSSHI